MNVFDWTVPEGSDAYEEWLDTRALLIDARPLVRPEESARLLEWGFLIFDQFRDGPSAGLWRPQYHLFLPVGFEQTNGGAPQPFDPLEPPQRFQIFNRTGWGGAHLKIVVLARSEANLTLAWGWDVHEGKTEDEARDMPSRLPALLDNETMARGKRPVVVETGFELSSFYEASSTAITYVSQSKNVEVQRTTPNGQPGPGGRLKVASTHGAFHGWTLASAVFDSPAGAGAFTLEADYRGHSIRAQGPAVKGPVGPRTPAGTTGVPLHFGYQSGDGGSRFAIDISYGEAPLIHRFRYLRIDVDERMDRLLGGSAFELWSEEKRIGP